MKTIEDVERLRAFLADDFQIGLLQIGTHEHYLGSQFIADDSEETPNDSMVFFAHPEQTSNVEINLVNQRQILVPFGVLNLVDSDRVDQSGDSGEAER